MFLIYRKNPLFFRRKTEDFLCKTIAGMTAELRAAPLSSNQFILTLVGFVQHYKMCLRMSAYRALLRSSLAGAYIAAV